MSNDNNTKSKSLDNTINIYDQLRCKIGESFHFWLGQIEDALEEAEDGKKLKDRHRALFEGQRLVKQLRSSTRAMAKTYPNVLGRKLDENDIKNLEDEYGKDVADYERARAGVWNNDNNQS